MQTKNRSFRLTLAIDIGIISTSGPRVVNTSATIREIFEGGICDQFENRSQPGSFVRGGAIMTVSWNRLFMESYPVAGASELQLQVVASSLLSPLTELEVDRVNSSQLNPFPTSDPRYRTFKPFDPRKWWFPSGPLPESYFDFLRWSNGGSFLNGERRFDPFLSTSNLREYLISYHFPQQMPGAIPFAIDGGGCFFVFDMRLAAIGGEYPVLFVGSGNLGYADAITVAPSFPKACCGSTNPAFLEMD